MVFDHKGRLIKANTSAERILAAVGVELSRVPPPACRCARHEQCRPPGNSDLSAWGFHLRIFSRVLAFQRMAPVIANLGR